MLVSMLRPLLLGTALLLPQLLSAQDWRTDPNARRLAWGNANVVLRSDSVQGVQIWANTSRVMDHSVPQRSFAARFDPDSVIGWLAYADRLLEANKPPRDDKARLQTPMLTAIDGSQGVPDPATGRWQVEFADQCRLRRLRCDLLMVDQRGQGRYEGFPEITLPGDDEEFLSAGLQVGVV